MLNVVYETGYLVQFLLFMQTLQDIPICVTADIGQVISQHLLCENSILNSKQNVDAEGAAMKGEA